MDHKKLPFGYGHDRCRDCKEIKRLRKALFFYANPDTYLGIGFFPHYPCGNFINDFGDTSQGCGRPGKLARKALRIK